MPANRNCLFSRVPSSIAKLRATNQRSGERDLSASPSYSQLLEAMRAGQVEQIVLLPKQDLVRVQFKDGKEAKVNIFPNDQEVLRTAEAHNVPLDVRNSQGKPP